MDHQSPGSAARQRQADPGGCSQSLADHRAASQNTVGPVAGQQALHRAGAADQRQGERQGRRHAKQARVVQGASQAVAGGQLHQSGKAADAAGSPERAIGGVVRQMRALHQRIGEQRVHAYPEQHMHRNGGGTDAEFRRTDDPGDGEGRHAGKQPGNGGFESRPKNMAPGSAPSRTRHPAPHAKPCGENHQPEGSSAMGGEAR